LEDATEEAFRRALQSAARVVDTGGVGTSGDPRRPGAAHTRGAAAGSGAAGGYHHGGSRSPGGAAYTPLGVAASHDSGGYSRLGVAASQDSGGYTRLGMSSTAGTPVQHEQAVRGVGLGSAAGALWAERERAGAGAAGMTAMGIQDANRQHRVADLKRLLVDMRR